MDENRFWDIIDCASAAGHRMPMNPIPRAPQPSGVEWEDDRQTLARLYPRLSTKYGRQD